MHFYSLFKSRQWPSKSDEEVVYFIDFYENNKFRVMFDQMNTPIIDFEI